MWKKGRKIEGVSASSFVEFRSLLYEKQVRGFFFFFFFFFFFWPQCDANLLKATYFH